MSDLSAREQLQFLQIIAEESPRIPDAKVVSDDERRRIHDSVVRMLAAVTALLEMVSPGEVDLRLQRSTLERQYIRLKKALVTHAPPQTVTQQQQDAHAAWLAAGGSGPGRLEIENQRLTDEWYGNVDLTFVRIAHSDLSNVNLGYAFLDEADLENVTFAGATLDGVSMTNASISGGSWTRAKISAVRLNGANIKGTDFTASDMERSTWFDAKVSGARFDGVRFGNAEFDRATFEHCSFRDANLADFSGKPEPTSKKTQFIDCDFTNTDWTKRSLESATFVRCKLAGVHGKPTTIAGLVVRECDVDLKTFVAVLQRDTLTVPEMIRELLDRTGASGGELHAFLEPHWLDGIRSWRAWDNVQQQTTHVEMVLEHYDLAAIERVTGPMRRTPLSAGVYVDRPGYSVSVTIEDATKMLHMLYRKVAPKDTRDPAPLLALIRETLPTLVEHPTLLADFGEWQQQRVSCERALAAARELLTFRDVPYAIKSWAGHYYGLLASRADRFRADAPRHGVQVEPEPTRSAVSELFERHRRQNAEDLVLAERSAIAKGKEPWNLARFEQLLNRGSQADRELDHMRGYYGGEYSMLADYARHLLEMEPWEDAR